MVTREMPMYNLDMIISVGYRVNSKRGVKFRQLVQVVGRTLQHQDITATTDRQALFDVDWWGVFIPTYLKIPKYLLFLHLFTKKEI